MSPLGRHAIGASPYERGAWVVVHRRLPAFGAPEPRDEQVLVRALALRSRVQGQVHVVAVETVGGSRQSLELDAAGVLVRLQPIGWARAIAEADELSGVVVTDIGLATSLLDAGVTAPLVLDIAELPSRRHATISYLDADDAREGASMATEAHVRREQRVFQAASLVVCDDATVESTVLACAPDTTTVVIAPAARVPTSVTLAGRRGVVVAGRFVTEPGLPDEDPLVLVLEAMAVQVDRALPLRLVALDGSVARRLLPARVEPVPADGAHLALDRARVVVLINGRWRDQVALAATGVPVVTAHDPLRDTLVARLLADDQAWIDEVAAANARLAAVSSTTRSIGRFLDALMRAALVPNQVGWMRGPAPSATTLAIGNSPPTWCAPSRAGTLAAEDRVGQRFRAEANGAQLLGRIPSLVANAGRSPAARHQLFTATHHAPFVASGVAQARSVRLRHRPCFSIVMPTCETDPALLDAAVASVVAQTYPRWQLCIADDASTRPETRAALDRARRSGAVLVERRTRGGIAAATNDALAAATGEWVAFCDHDDELRPDALYWIARLLESNPELDLVYSDEDKLADGQDARIEPFAKPSWSPDLLLSLNYITHLTAVRRTLVTEVGGLRSGFDGAQDYDLLLRLTEHTDRIGHVPRPLYAWRKVAGSTAARIEAKPEADDAGARALRDAIARRGLDAEVVAGPQPTWHRLRYRTDDSVLVSVLLPTRDRVDLLAPCIERLLATVRHPRVELIVIDNQSTDPATLAYLEDLDEHIAPFTGRVVRYPHPFNFARQMNLGALAAQGEVLLLLNNDVRPLSEGWFESLLEHALRPEVGAVGALLRWPHGGVQHAGIVLNVGGVAYNLDPGPHAVWRDVVRNTAAVTGACLMTRAQAFAAVGGMDERLRVAYNDVDLCLRLGEAGYRVVYTPAAVLEHPESSSRGALHPAADEAFYQRRFGPPGTAPDPFAATGLDLYQPYSPQL
jgi:GT2 family glycosyltransferase